MWSVFRAECFKLRKSPIWLLMFVGPAIATLVALFPDHTYPWHMTLSTIALVYGMLFLPLMTGVFAAIVCRFEHAGGGWKQLLALPVTRSSVFLSKFAVVMGLLLMSQLLVGAGLLLAAQVMDYPGPVPWDLLARSLLGSWIACLPLAALQMGVSVAWQSFAAPLAVNVVFTLPNILVANSERFGPYYPWAQPALAMLPREADSFGAFNLPLESLFVVVAGSFVLFLGAGYAYFLRKPV